MVYFDNGFLIFGGLQRNSATSAVVRLDLSTTSWIKLGDLTVPRSYHDVVYDGEVFMVIGGSTWNGTVGHTEMNTEKCSISESTMTCLEQSPMLNNYHRHPALIMVPEDFCTEI